MNHASTKIGFSMAIAVGAAQFAFSEQVTFTETPTNTSTYYAQNGELSFAPSSQTFTVDSTAFTVSFNSLTVSAPQITAFNQSVTQVTGGTPISGTLPIQYTPVVTTTGNLDIQYNAFTYTFDAQPNLALPGVPNCGGTSYCVSAPISATPTITLTGSWDWTGTGGAQSGAFTESLAFVRATSNYSIDLGDFPNSAALQGGPMALYSITGFTGSTSTPVGSLQDILYQGDGALELTNGEIAPVPLPASAWLMLSGLGCSAFLRRKRGA